MQMPSSRSLDSTDRITVNRNSGARYFHFSQYIFRSRVFTCINYLNIVIILHKIRTPSCEYMHRNTIPTLSLNNLCIVFAIPRYNG